MAGAVRSIGRAGEAFVDEAGGDPAVLEHEGDLAGETLEHGTVRGAATAGAWIEEAGVVDANLPLHGVEGDHLGGAAGRHRDCFPRRQDVEDVGVEREGTSGAWEQRLPETAVGTDQVESTASA